MDINNQESFMDENADRDRLWCRALVATLGIDEIARVTAEFNRIRPDAAQQSVKRTVKKCSECKVVGGHLYTCSHALDSYRR